MDDWDNGDLGKEDSDYSKYERAAKFDDSVSCVPLLDLADLIVNPMEIMHMMFMEFLHIAIGFLHRLVSLYQNLQHFRIVELSMSVSSLKIE